MSDESNHREIVSLRDYFDGRLGELEKRFEQQRVSTERALDKAEQALGRRLDAMNEFRDALKDQAARMATQEQLDRVRDRIVDGEKKAERTVTPEHLETVKGRVTEIEKRIAVTAAIWSMVVSIVVGLAVRFLIK